MTKKKSTAAEDIEIKVGDEIPFEDETTYKAQSEEADIVGDLRNLGQQFAETMRTAWNSEERKEFELHETRDREPPCLAYRRSPGIDLLGPARQIFEAALNTVLPGCCRVP